MYDTALEAYKTSTFIGQLLLTMILNFGVNFGFEFATMSSWGKYPDRTAWPGITATNLDTPVNNCLLLDIPLTSFMMGYLCSLLATGGTQKDVRQKKCDVLNPDAVSKGLWLYTPVPIRDLCLRSLVMGVYVTAIVGFPTFLLMWASIKNGSMNGYSYTVFKGVWAMFVSGLVYTLVFPAAICKSNFPELEFEELLNKAVTDE